MDRSNCHRSRGYLLLIFIFIFCCYFIDLSLLSYCFVLEVFVVGIVEMRKGRGRD